jgi:hypothetical protein
MEQQERNQVSIHGPCFIILASAIPNALHFFPILQSQHRQEVKFLGDPNHIDISPHRTQDASVHAS